MVGGSAIVYGDIIQAYDKGNVQFVKLMSRNMHRHAKLKEVIGVIWEEYIEGGGIY